MTANDLKKAHSFKLPNGNNLERVIVPLTKSGKPAYWESGGGMTSTGRATIVTDRNYQRLKPLYVNRKGKLSNGDHALLPLAQGYKIIEVKHHRSDFDITIFRVVSIVGNIGLFEVESQFSAETQNAWKHQICNDAVQAGINKSQDYHCKVPHFVID